MMFHRRITHWMGSLTLSGLVLLGATFFPAGEAARAEEARDSFDAVRSMLLRHSSGEYWLGLACQRPSAALRSQLQMGDGKGLVVRRVLPDSPADQAGLRSHDVILKFGETEVGKIRDLTRAIDERKDEETLVTFVRHAREQTAKVTPAKRQVGGARGGIDDTDADHVLRWLDETYWEAVRDFDQAIESEIDDDSVRFRFFHPGTVLEEELDRLGIELPQDLKIAITNPDHGPAKILIEKDGESWELSTDDIDWNELPAGMRRYVEFFLGDATADSEAKDPAVKNLPAADELPKIEFNEDHEEAETGSNDASRDDKTTARRGIEAQLETMEAQLHRLRQEFQQLLDERNNESTAEPRNPNRSE